ncbi:MAG: lytic transglycosylase domain-containing protein [Candidatus Binataceae bacterium]
MRNRIAITALICGLLSAVPAAASMRAHDIYARAARRAGVAPDLLIAVAGAESGWHPWALNIHGQAYYCGSRARATGLLRSADDADIGLMQINFAFWGHRLGYSKDQLLQPATNLYAGALILKQLLGRPGSFWGRLSAYHSAKPAARRQWSQAVYGRYLCYLSGRPMARSCDAAETAASSAISRR